MGHRQRVTPDPLIDNAMRRAPFAYLLISLAWLGPILAQSPTGARDERFTTNRESDVELALTDERRAFTFAVFGDRTGGPPEGVRVLADAVRDTNAIGPDLVMTVGDLVQGYNTTPDWMRQMLEFRGIMDGLDMPWYPVAGNHDIYWRGPDRPPLEHEGNYETHFGPLWYAFEHKECWFVALFSDETNPETGKKTFRDPAHQRMSRAQLDWLRKVLGRTRDARHVFLFLHHPRWLGGRYGDDWKRVHRVLKAAGNVTAVFAGHIHHARYDGSRDGIEYFTLSTTGGSQRGDIPRAGFLHHFDLVTVRDDGIAVASIPVGQVVDARSITGEVSQTARQLARELVPVIEGRVACDWEAMTDTTLQVHLTNPTEADVEIVARGTSADPRWWFAPDHVHFTLAGGTTEQFELRVIRERPELDSAFRVPVLRIDSELLAPGLRVPLPTRDAALPMDLGTLPAPPVPETDYALRVDGHDDYVEIAHGQIPLPNGPLTLEAWICADSFAKRTGLVTKTQNCEFGLFVGGGRPQFFIHLDGRYAEASADELRLRVEHWHHLAGVFDGEEARLYVDGKLVAAVAASGDRTVRDLPLIVGGDVDGDGRLSSPFDGLIDELRLSRVARYSGERFEPARRHITDDDTLLLLHMDADLGPWLHDASPRGIRPVRRDGARVVRTD